MADAVGRLTRQPGVCLATTGPGATNLLTGVGGAMRDSSPVLVMTCNNRMGEMGRDDAQNADHVAIFRPHDEVGDARRSTRMTIPRVLHEAAIRATSGCPGPCWSTLPETRSRRPCRWRPRKGVGYGAAAGSRVRRAARAAAAGRPGPGRAGRRRSCSREEPGALDRERRSALRRGGGRRSTLPSACRLPVDHDLQRSRRRRSRTTRTSSGR